MRRTLAVCGPAACIALGLASTARAGTTPVQLTYDYVVLDTPSTSNQEVVSPQTQPLSVTAQVDPSTGGFTIAPSDWHFPTYKLTSPVSGTINVTLKQPATGNIDFSTGRLTVTADVIADIDVPAFGGDCRIDAGSTTLTTSTTKPLPGQAFPAGETGAISGPGAFGVGWSTLPAGTGPSCPTVDSAVDGPGGIWISRDISPVPANVTLTIEKLRAVRRGSTAVLTATPTNTGGNAASGLKLCLKAPEALRVRPTCQTVPSLAAGKSTRQRFRIRTTKHAHGKYRLSLKLSGAGLPTVARTVTLTVR